MRYVRLDDLLRNDLIRFVVQKHPCLRFLSRFVFQAKRLTQIICHKIAELAVLSFETRMALRTTVRPVLSGHPLLSGQQPKSPNLFPLFTSNETFIKRTPLLSGRGHLKVFLLLPTCIKRTLVIKFHNPTSRHRECERLPRIAIHKFFEFYIKT